MKNIMLKKLTGNEDGKGHNRFTVHPCNKYTDEKEMRAMGKRMRAVSHMDRILDEFTPLYSKIKEYLEDCSHEEAIQMGEELSVYFDALKDFTYSRGKYKVKDDRIVYLKEIKKIYDAKINSGRKATGKKITKESEIEKILNDKKKIVESDDSIASVVSPESDAKEEPKIRKPPAAIMPSSKHDTYVHTGFDLTRYAHHTGIIDEDENFYLLNCMLLRRGLVVVEGPSSTGKTYMVDRCLELYPEKIKAKFATGSKRSYFYKPELQTGDVRILYLVEIQMALRDNKEVEEMVKTIGEGKDFVRPVVDPSTKETFNIFIPKDSAIVGTHAYENDFIVSDEIKNRALELVTKFGQEHNKKITMSEAQKQYTLERDKFISEEEIKSLMRHIEKCFYMTNLTVINPFADLINNIYPSTNKYNRLQKMYYEMIKGSAVFNHHNRVADNLRGAIFVDLEDFYNVFRAYHVQCMHDLLDIPMTAESIIKVFNNGQTGSRKRITEEEIRTALSGDKSLNATVIRKTLDALTDKLYLKRVGNGARGSYEKIKDLERFEYGLDLSSCYETGEQIIQANFPDYAQRWRDNHIHKNVRGVLDYRTNEVVEF